MLGGAIAAPIAIGVSADVTSVDPHYFLYSPNLSIADHIYGKLVDRDEQLRMQPGLAVSWKTIDDVTWEFKLRPNVVFHDGSPFTADDVVFSIERVGQIKDSPGPLTIYTKEIATAIAVDPLTLRIKTKRPHPLLLNDMAIVPIVSKRVAQGATTADFNSGKVAVGTGPYRLVRYARGDRVELTRSETYWGKKPLAEALTFKILTNDASRVAALMSGDVQVIESVPVADLARLKDSPDLNIVRRPSMRLIFLYVDAHREQSPFVTDKSGQPLQKNPLKDLRVRQALSMAIDRDLLRTRIMEGASVPTAQLMIQGLPGHTSNLSTERHDPAAAKKLLADAGYPQGFNLTLHGPNNRYVQDGPILQAVAQMFSKVGVQSKVETMPAAVFFPRNTKSEFSVSLTGWSPDTAEGSSPLRALIATRDPNKGFGGFNSGNYSNPKVDDLLERALATIDDGDRNKSLQSATEIAMKDLAIIPLHHQVNIWAARKPITFGGRADERTNAADFSVAH